MTRREEIEIAAQNLYCACDICEGHQKGFIAGAEWADANPIDFIGDLITQRSIAFDYGRDQASMLKVAIETLTSISNNSCCNQCQEDKLVSESALKKIEEMKKEFDNGK